MSFSILSWQSRTLALLCAADFASTVWLCCAHDAAEANPLMAFFLARGVLAFAAAKVTLTAGPLLILEWARAMRPRLGTLALNTALLGYVALYGAGLARINAVPCTADPSECVNKNPVYEAWLEGHNRRIEALRQAARLQTSLATPSATYKLPKFLPVGPSASPAPSTYTQVTTLE
jgi:hypothetical protein